MARQGRFFFCAHCASLSHFVHLLSQGLGSRKQVDYIEHGRTPHQPMSVVTPYSRPFIFTTPPSETRFSLSTLELLERLPFPVSTRISCGNHTGRPALRVVRSYIDLLSIRRQGGELSDADATPNPTPGVAQLSLASTFQRRIDDQLTRGSASRVAHSWCRSDVLARFAVYSHRGSFIGEGNIFKALQ